MNFQINFNLTAIVRRISHRMVQILETSPDFTDFVEGSIMTGTNGQSKWTNARWLGLRIFLVVYDILAVNAAFFLALLTRFYVADEFHAVSRQFIDAYISYAPYYTAFCILVFACFKLYSGIWRYAGFNDLSRIFAANIICLLGHVVGTLLFVRRMPVSVYCIGTVIQLDRHRTVIDLIRDRKRRVVIVRRTDEPRRIRYRQLAIL